MLITTIAGISITGIVMILPLWLLSRYDVRSSIAATAAAGGTAVGIGAIFRSVSRDILRTSVGVVSRTAARAVSRHWTHLVIQWFTHTFTKQRIHIPHDGTPHPILSIVMGCVSLALSYGAVLMLVAPGDRANVLGSISVTEAACLAAVPLLCYYAIAYVAGRRLDVRVVPRTEFDGLLLQLYFTLALSYLPLTSDGEYHGHKNRRALVAAVTIGGLFVLHLILGLVGQIMASELVTHLAVLFLIQAFVMSFPFAPLDGKHLWHKSKLLWLVAWVPMFIAFHYRIPEHFYGLM